MQKFIAQKDSPCQYCYSDLPRGSWVYIDEDVDGYICEDCYEEKYK